MYLYVYTAAQGMIAVRIGGRWELCYLKCYTGVFHFVRPQNSKEMFHNSLNYKLPITLSFARKTLNPKP